MPAGVSPRRSRTGRRCSGLGREIFEPVRTYSGGMLRKLEIVRSLIHRPRVLFLDEPTTGLDAPSRRDAVGATSRPSAREHGTTIFLTTHYLEEAEQADRICIIDAGRIVATGTPAELKAELATRVPDRRRRRSRALRAELTRLGLHPTGDGPFRIAVATRETHAMLRSIETPLTLVRTHAPASRTPTSRSSTPSRRGLGRADATEGRDGCRRRCRSRRIPSSIAHRWRADLSSSGIAHRDRSSARPRPTSRSSLPAHPRPAPRAGAPGRLRSPGGLDLTTFVFTGVLAQTIWQSAAMGSISLIADREEDFSQEIFVSPVSRYSIVAGKIIGESLVALPTGLGIVVVGILSACRCRRSCSSRSIPVLFVVAIYGGAFGLLVLVESHRASGRRTRSSRSCCCRSSSWPASSTRSTTCRCCWRSCRRCRRCATRSRRSGTSSTAPARAGRPGV